MQFYRRIVFGYVNKQISGLHDERKVTRYIVATRLAIMVPMLIPRLRLIVPIRYFIIIFFLPLVSRAILIRLIYP